MERVYCGHAYHHDCLILYLKSPPFTGGKKCPGCGNRIYHEKWKVTPELAEARWVVCLVFIVAATFTNHGLICFFLQVGE